MEKLPLEQWGVQARGGFWHGELFVFSVVRESTHGLYQFDPLLPKDSAMLRLAGGSPGFKDGGLAEAQFNWPTGVCRSSGSALCVADTENHLIRTISGDQVSTRIGNGMPGDRDGQLAVAQLNKPMWISENASNLVIIEKDGGNKVRVLNKANDVLTTVTLPGGSVMPPTVPSGINRFAETFALTTPSGIFTMSITSNPLIPKSTAAELSLAIGLARAPFHSAACFAKADGSDNFILFNIGSLIRVLTPDQEILELPGIKFTNPSQTHLIITVSKQGRVMVLDADAGSLHHFLFNPFALKQQQPAAIFAPAPSEAPRPASPPTLLDNSSNRNSSTDSSQNPFLQQPLQGGQNPYPTQHQHPPQQQSQQPPMGTNSDPRLSNPRFSDPRLSDPRLSDPRLNDPRLQTQTPPPSVAPNTYPANTPGTPTSQQQPPAQQQQSGSYPSGYPPQGFPPHFDQGARSGSPAFNTGDSRQPPGTPPHSGLPLSSPYATPSFNSPSAGSSSHPQLPPYGMPPQQGSFGSPTQSGHTNSPTFSPQGHVTVTQPQQQFSPYGTTQMPSQPAYQVSSPGGAYGAVGGGFPTQVVQQASPQYQQTAAVQSTMATPVQVIGTSTSHSPKKTPAWSWFDHGTVWQNYEPNIAQQLDDAYWKGAVEFFFMIGSTKYRIDLNTDQPKQHPVGQPTRTRKIRPPKGYVMPLGGMKR